MGGCVAKCLGGGLDRPWSPPEDSLNGDAQPKKRTDDGHAPAPVRVQKKHSVCISPTRDIRLNIAAQCEGAGTGSDDARSAAPSKETSRTDKTDGESATGDEKSRKEEARRHREKLKVSRGSSMRSELGEQKLNAQSLRQLAYESQQAAAQVAVDLNGDPIMGQDGEDPIEDEKRMVGVAEKVVTRWKLQVLVKCIDTWVEFVDDKRAETMKGNGGVKVDGGTAAPEIVKEAGGENATVGAEKLKVEREREQGHEREQGGDEFERLEASLSSSDTLIVDLNLSSRDIGHEVFFMGTARGSRECVGVW